MKMMIRYMSHVQDLGWENYVNDGAMSGTKGKAKRLEAIKVQINNADVAGEVEYRTHVQNLGWENKWTKNGAVSGSVGKSLRLEALQIRLTEPCQINMICITEFTCRIMAGLTGQKMERLPEQQDYPNGWKPLKFRW